MTLEILLESLDRYEWQELALCNGFDTEKFFDQYESSPRLARAMDEMCLSCPVQKMCLEAGVEGKEYGLWGGVYLNNGKADTQYNVHKTKETWDAIRNGI